MHEGNGAADDLEGKSDGGNKTAADISNFDEDDRSSDDSTTQKTKR